MTDGQSKKMWFIFLQFRDTKGSNLSLVFSSCVTVVVDDSVVLDFPNDISLFGAYKVVIHWPKI